MMFILVAAATVASATPADSVQYYYAHRDVSSLQSLCHRTVSREDDLLCRYRLYPLTSDARLLENLPDGLPGATARELALLSGLWGFRAAQGSVIDMVRFGRRSHGLLAAARDIEPEDPLVLLIEGQSLLFRPEMFGGDPQKALLRFRKLHGVVSRGSDGVISTMEADLWTWLSLSRLGDASAGVLKAYILSQSPPPLYAEFLQNPPG